MAVGRIGWTLKWTKAPRQCLRRVLRWCLYFLLSVFLYFILFFVFLPRIYWFITFLSSSTAPKKEKRKKKKNVLNDRDCVIHCDVPVSIYPSFSSLCFFAFLMLSTIVFAFFISSFFVFERTNSTTKKSSRCVEIVPEDTFMKYLTKTKANMLKTLVFSSFCCYDFVLFLCSRSLYFAWFSLPVCTSHWLHSVCALVCTHNYLSLCLSLTTHNSWYLRGFIEGMHGIKWCPNPKCDRAIQYEGGGERFLLFESSCFDRCICGFAFFCCVGWSDCSYAVVVDQALLLHSLGFFSRLLICCGCCALLFPNAKCKCKLGAEDVDCSCGHRWCFKCSDEAHSPCPCPLVCSSFSFSQNFLRCLVVLITRYLPLCARERFPRTFFVHIPSLLWNHRVWMYVCMYACMCICVYVCVYVCLSQGSKMARKRKMRRRQRWLDSRQLQSMSELQSLYWKESRVRFSVSFSFSHCLVWSAFLCCHACAMPFCVTSMRQIICVVCAVQTTLLIVVYFSMLFNDVVCRFFLHAMCSVCGCSFV